jgi:protease-4
MADFDDKINPGPDGPGSSFSEPSLNSSSESPDSSVSAGSESTDPCVNAGSESTEPIDVASNVTGSESTEPGNVADLDAGLDASLDASNDTGIVTSSESTELGNNAGSDYSEPSVSSGSDLTELYESFGSDSTDSSVSSGSDPLGSLQTKAPLEAPLEPPLEPLVEPPLKQLKSPAPAPEPSEPMTAASNNNTQNKRRQGAPFKGSSTSWLTWPMVFLIVSFLTIGSCSLGFITVVDSFSLPSKFEQLNAPAIGVIDIQGEIFDTRWAVEALRNFDENEHIKAIVLRVDSPGGAVAPCQELYQALTEFTKPIVVSMGSVAASGGLYIAMASNTILANPGTITGSIGVIMETIEFDEALSKLGIRSQVIKSGAYKDIGSPFRAMSEEERALLQTMVNSVYQQFVSDVVDGRPQLDEQEVLALADGRVFNGEEALKVGLIDELGGFRQAIVKATSLAGMPGEDLQLIYENGRSHWLKELLEAKLGFLEPVESVLNQGTSLKFLYRPGLF